MATRYNDQVFLAREYLLDAKWGPFESPEAAKAAVDPVYRSIGLFAIIAPPGGVASLYWYQNNITDLVPFTGNSSVEVYDVKTGATGGQTEFPPTGFPNVIYIDKSTSSSYYWNTNTNPPEYTLTGSGEGSVEVYPSKTGSTPGTDSFPTIGTVNVIYIADNTNISYVWNSALNNNAGDYEVISGAGKGILSIERTSGNGSPGTTDTYTVTYSDTSTYNFSIYNGTNGTNGVGITSITWTSSTGGGSAGIAGATDTYTITYTNSTTSTFNVYNGIDGGGSIGFEQNFLLMGA